MKGKAFLWPLVTVTLAATSCMASPSPSEMPTRQSTPAATPTLLTRPMPSETAAQDAPMGTLSLQAMLAYVEHLTGIQPYSGWRNSATTGEQEAVEYVAGVLDSFTTLKEMGLTVEEEEFRVFMATEVWQAELYIHLDGQDYEIPVNAPRGPRDDLDIAVHFDSDGQLGDEEPNPLVVHGPALLLDSEDELKSLSAEQARGKIVFLDYALVDRTLWPRREVEARAAQLLRAQPSALVPVTSWSPKLGESQGSFAYEGSPFHWVKDNGTPIVVARLEDMVQAGIDNMRDLGRVTEARVLLDTDVMSPGRSRNLIAKIPGRDDAQALIVGAHIDSPNNPGAMDDGSGSAILLELARVLDQTGFQPGITTYLVWFGSEELFLYGSNTFANRHQDLLDRTVAMLQVDCLIRPPDGMTGITDLYYWSYGHYGDARYPFGEFLRDQARRLGVSSRAQDLLGLVSDNGAFSGFDVPNADVGYGIAEEAEMGGVQTLAGIHAAYDTIHLAAEGADALLGMAQIALGTVIALGEDKPELRTTPPDQARAVFVGTQTEPPYIGPSALTDFAMAFEHGGLDVDLIPYGATLSAEDLQEAKVVFALPAIDYPCQEASNIAEYDVAWADQEIELLQEYVEDGGLLVLVNSKHRLKYGYPPLDQNEDWPEMNALGEVFGITFHEGSTWGELASASTHALMQDSELIRLADSNGVPFTYDSGETLAQAHGDAVIALVPYGAEGGEVLVIADLGILRASPDQATPRNLQFWVNLAEYAKSR